MALAVTRWRDVHQAVSVLAESLEKYDLKGSTGVLVRGIECVPLPKKSKQPSKEIETCRSSTSSPKTQMEDMDSAFSPKTDDIKPGEAIVRFHYSSVSDVAPRFIDTRPMRSTVSFTPADAMHGPRWVLKTVVRSPQIPHEVAFFIVFGENASLDKLSETGTFGSTTASMDVPLIEHGASCKIASFGPENNAGGGKVVNVLGTSPAQNKISGYWRGNILMEPAFYSPDAKPTGEKFVIESIIFNQIELRP